jgi:hypothetical protein
MRDLCVGLLMLVGALCCVQAVASAFDVMTLEAQTKSQVAP